MYIYKIIYYQHKLLRTRRDNNHRQRLKSGYRYIMLLHIVIQFLQSYESKKKLHIYAVVCIPRGIIGYLARHHRF